MKYKTPKYEIEYVAKHGRFGKLHLIRDERELPSLSTPVLYPVVSLMTGVTPRGGGIWKYVLRDCMKQNIPLLSQVLHFIDYNLSPKHVKYWREKPLRERYREQYELGEDYNAPLFLDSGGFKLLYNSNLDLSEYQICTAKDIVDLQIDLGGDIVATLDYPFPPNIKRDEAKKRMQKSASNVIETAKYLEDKDVTPYLYVCCHGQTRDDIRNYVKDIFHQMKAEGFSDFGIAIGSVVPLRSKRKYRKIIEIVKGAIEGIPEEKLENTPVHAFGIAGNFIPLLAYLGVDSFDSTSYIQAARRLSYIDPISMQNQSIYELEELECDCRICRQVDLFEIQKALAANKSFKPVYTGKYKSEYYAYIALHNLEVDFGILENTKSAIQADDVTSAIIEQMEKEPHIKEAVEWLSRKDSKLRSQLTKTILTMKKKRHSFFELLRNSKQLLLFEDHEEQQERTISLNFTPDSFVIPEDYSPPDGKRILLIIPCSGKKPYSKSRTHSILMSKIKDAFGEKAKKVHKVTLSGLYGPVPVEFEHEKPVLEYDFRLHRLDEEQIELCASRIEEYLDKYASHYSTTLGYATSLAYRKVLEKVAKSHDDFVLLPTKPRRRTISEFFRQCNTSELLDMLESILSET